jgi:hypothetical protein
MAALLALAPLVTVAAVALADTLSVDGDTLQSGTQSSVQVTRTGGGTAKYTLQANGGDNTGGTNCNAATVSGTQYNVTVSLSELYANPADSDWLSLLDSSSSPVSSLSLSGCGDANGKAVQYQVSSTAPLGHSVTVRGTPTGGKPSNNGYSGPDSGSAKFDITVVPRPPSGLSAFGNTPSEVGLSWTATPDSADITDYVIFRGGTQIGTAAKTATSFSDTGLSASTEYCYSIKARVSGTPPLLSAASNASCATTPANTAPSKPDAPVLDPSSTTPNQGVFGLDWSDAIDDGLPSGSISYQLQHKDANDLSYSSVAGAGSLSTSAFAFTLISPETEGTWTYQVRASDGSLNSDYSDPSTAIVVDTTGPSPPTAGTNPSTPDYVDPSDSSNAWFKDSVTVSYSGSTDPGLLDGSAGSGVAGYTGDQTFNTSGSHPYSGKATDSAGNDSSSTTGTVKVDATDPTVSITGCPVDPDGSGPLVGQVIKGSSQTIDVSATDGQSGLATDPSGTGISLPTSSVGLQSVSYTAVDNVGHSKDATCDYQVIYNWYGFYAPIDNPVTGKMNGVKAGSAVPVRFGLSGYQGMGIFGPGSPNPSSKSFTCGTDPEVSTDTPTAADSAAGLSYDPTTDTYTYVWKTSKTFAGQCRRLTVGLDDGTSHYVDFKVMR